MPHAYLKQFKSILSQVAALKLGDLEAFVINYAEEKVYEIIDKLQKECPPPEVLEALARQVDSIKKLMNKGDRTIGTISKLPAKLDPAIKAGLVVTEILGHMPIPSTIGGPGPVGVIFSVPMGVIQSQSQLLSWTSTMVETLENDQKKIKSLLSSTQGIFEPIKSKLAIIESLLSRCASNPNLSDEERRAIIQGLNKTGGSTVSGNKTPGGVSYVSDSGKSYTLLVVKDINENTVAPRRQAIAKDYRGIVILKGPLSFASSEEILIEELKFRIDNQLP